MVLRTIYTILLLIISPVFMYLLYKKRPGKAAFGSRWVEHFGFTPHLNNDGKKVIWVHAVSVGETIAVTPFIQRLKNAYPDVHIVITTTTASGADQAKKIYPIAEHRYMPFDFSWMVTKFINSLNPTQLIIMETELWPNTLLTVKKHNIPITIINARLSERSYLRYKKVLPLFGLISPCIDHLICQYKSDAERFIKLGIKKDCISVFGSMKFDINIPTKIKRLGSKLRSQLGVNRHVWIASSTHLGEDSIILSAHNKLLIDHPKALLILVPRHPERFDSVFQLCKKSGFKTVRRSQVGGNCNLSDVQIYLGDSMGEMLTLIAGSDICFMGGSLLGDRVGGHNYLEPAMLAKPILSGPSFYNFHEIANQLIKNKALTIVSSDQEIFRCINQLFSNEEQRLKQGIAAEWIVERNRGAIDKTIEHLSSNYRDHHE
jgi:3-deoxy-D-manno-octulosonic-acid transferase